MSHLSKNLKSLRRTTMSIHDLSFASSASSRKSASAGRLFVGTSLFRGFICGLMFLLLSSPATMRSQSLQYVPVISNYVSNVATVCSGATDTAGDGCTLTQVATGNPAGGMIFDNAGNLYFTDAAHKTVRRVDAVTGIVTLVAGGATTVCSAGNSVGDGCPATQAKFTSAVQIVFDPYGNLVIGDISGYRVRRIDKTTGIITTIAGTGVIATAVPNNTTPALATATPLAQVNGLAYDRAGNLYIGNYGFSFVSVVPAINGTIDPANCLMYNVAGNGTVAATGDGGAPTAAEIGSVRGLAMDPAGNLYIGDWASYKMRVISPIFKNGALALSSATINTIAGTGTADPSPYGAGNGGLATAAKINEMVGIALDSTGILYLNQYKGDDIRTVNLNTSICSEHTELTCADLQPGCGTIFRSQSVSRLVHS
jgi:sugar lactone lactonase YvrE